MTSKRPFTIIVVGGGVAGLSLASMLEKFDLEYLLLEAYDDIIAPAGAGIGLMPNGSFIMDQLGCYEAIRTAAQDSELENSHIRDRHGKSLISMKHMMYHEEKQHGYPMLFFNRQWFLKVLYDLLKHKDRIHLNCRADCVKPIEGGIQVTTKDGKTFTGDILIGADGIHSNVRKEMRRIADATDPRYFEPGEEDNVPCYYQCSYGIAQHVEGWPGREHGITAGRKSSFLVVSGPGGRVYWFLFVKLPVVKKGKEIPKYSKEDEAQFVKEHGSLKIKEELTFGQVYAKRLTSTLTPLHEVVYKKWFFDRIFLMGDSAHKPNPIGGMGANAAIETAAEFINALLDMKAERQNRLEDMAPNEIKVVFKRVQDVRFERAGFTVSASHDLQALTAFEDPILATLAFRVLMPLAGEHKFFRDLSKRIVGGSRMRHLDLPSRPHALPYDHELPAKPLRVLPSRVAAGFCSCVMILLIYTANSATKMSPAELRSWGEFVPLNRNWLVATAVNDSSTVPTFPLSFPAVESDTLLGMQLIYFLTHMLSPLLIYTAEGYRIGRHGTLLSLPIIFILGIRFQGLDTIAPIYALLSVLQSEQNPIDRPIRVDDARYLVLALVVVITVPTILLIAPTPVESRWQDWIQLLPLFFSLLTALLSSVLRRRRRLKDDEHSDKHPEWYSTDDIPILKFAYRLAFAVQAIAHLATIYHTCFHPNDSSLSTAFWGSPIAFQGQWDLAPWPIKGLGIPRHDLVLAVAAIAVHNLYSVWELRCQGYISTFQAVKAASAVVLGQVVFGSGATWAALWSWREDVIAGVSVPDGGKALK